MKYDLDSYLARKRISLEDFAANNNIRTLNDLGMFILNNKMFDVSDSLVEKLTVICLANEPPKETQVEDLEIIAPLSSMESGEQQEDPAAKPSKKSKATSKVQTD